MIPSFNDLVRIYRKSESINDSGERSLCLETEEDLNLVKELSNDDSCDLTALEVDGDLVVGNVVKLIFGVPKPQYGRIYADIKGLINGDFTIDKSAITQSPFLIKQENLASFDDNPTIKTYHILKDFLQHLVKMSSYSDSINKKLIFFSKRTFELSFGVNHIVDDFVSVINSLDSEKCKVITDFQDWLNDESTSSHIDEKRSILAFVLTDSLPQNANFLDVIKQIQHISKSVQAQYALYLENFSYEKFVKKLEENTEKFVSKINDTISKVLPQFLGLPFLTAIPTALKSEDNWLVSLALIAYCIMCFYGLTNQKLVLDHLRQDVDNFENKGKIPEKLRSQWKDDKNRIGKLLRKQRHLYRFLFTTLAIFLCYGFVRFLLHTGIIVLDKA